jgi:hypothetical protein
MILLLCITLPLYVLYGANQHFRKWANNRLGLPLLSLIVLLLAGASM